MSGRSLAGFLGTTPALRGTFGLDLCCPFADFLLEPPGRFVGDHWDQPVETQNVRVVQKREQSRLLGRCELPLHYGPRLGHTLKLARASLPVTFFTVQLA
jgi:hypothetical protein